jgi:hypothetical protein
MPDELPSRQRPLWTIGSVVVLTALTGLLIFFFRSPATTPHVQPWQLIVQNHHYDQQTVIAEGCVVAERTYPAPSTPLSVPHLTQYWLADGVVIPCRGGLVSK